MLVEQVYSQIWQLAFDMEYGKSCPLDPAPPHAGTFVQMA